MPRKYGNFPNNIGTSPSILYGFPVDNNVIENDVVYSLINNGTGQSPHAFKKAINGGDSYYPAIYGIAKSVSGGFADIYVGKGMIVDGFSFGVFINVEMYLDGANPGLLTYTAPAVGSSVNAIRIGRAMDATHLLLDPISNFVQQKGGIYTNDGTYDEVQSPGSNGTVLVYDSTQTNGFHAAAAVVVSAPFTYTTATRTLTVATATNSVPGVLSAADHTTYSGYAATIALKAPLASPIFTGDVNSSTGNVLISTLGKGLQIKTGTNSKIGQATLVAGTVIVLNSSITANSRISLTVSTAGGTQGFLRYSKVNGTSFTITSTSVLETSVVDWHIIESIP